MQVHRSAWYLATLSLAAALFVKLNEHISPFDTTGFANSVRTHSSRSTAVHASSDDNTIVYARTIGNATAANAPTPEHTSINTPQTESPLEGCLSASCINKLASRIARAYPCKKQSWCVEYPRKRDGTWQGIILVKLPKGASSTSAGVALRIGDRHNCSAVQWNHRMASDYRDHAEGSLLFTTIRDPSSRAVSRVFFSHISRFQHLQRNTEKILMEKLPSATNPQFGTVSAGQGGFQLRYTSLEKIPPYSAWDESLPEQVLDPTRVVEHVMQTFYNYTMMLVTERMDESLVALALILGIDVGDVLVQVSKVSGTSNYFYLRPKQICYAIVKTSVPSNVQSFLDSNQWRAMNYGDFLLHAVANQSLDLTVASLQPEFDTAMVRYQALMALVREQCPAETAFPCSADGEPQLELAEESCYKKDAGCGHRCVDRVIAEYDTRKVVTT